MHDDVVDVFVLGQPTQHQLQPRPGGRARRLAPVHELGHYFCAEIMCLAGAGVALGWNRVALRRAVTVGLFSR